MICMLNPMAQNDVIYKRKDSEKQKER
jgi:hypothetical protein